jgi:hypothetical protein
LLESTVPHSDGGSNSNGRHENFSQDRLSTRRDSNQGRLDNDLGSQEAVRSTFWIIFDDLRTCTARKGAFGTEMFNSKNGKT